MQRFVDSCAAVAALVCAIAIAGFGAKFAEFSHLQHPVGLLGGSHVPRAVAFNLLAFVLPGMLAAIAAVAVRGRLSDASMIARVGAQALLLSAIAFAAQGLLPLDSLDLDGGRSRLHAAAWTAWWLAFAVAGIALAVGLRGHRGRRSGQWLLVCAIAAVGLALLAPMLVPAGLAQRLAFATWFFGVWLAGRRQP